MQPERGRASPGFGGADALLAAAVQAGPGADGNPGLARSFPIRRAPGRGGGQARGGLSGIDGGQHRRHLPGAACQPGLVAVDGNAQLLGRLPGGKVVGDEGYLLVTRHSLPLDQPQAGNAVQFAPALGQDNRHLWAVHPGQTAAHGFGGGVGFDTQDFRQVSYQIILTG